MIGSLRAEQFARDQSHVPTSLDIADVRGIFRQANVEFTQAGRSLVATETLMRDFKRWEEKNHKSWGLEEGQD